MAILNRCRERFAPSYFGGRLKSNFDWRTTSHGCTGIFEIRVARFSDNFSATSVPALARVAVRTQIDRGAWLLVSTSGEPEQTNLPYRAMKMRKNDFACDLRENKRLGPMPLSGC